MQIALLFAASFALFCFLIGIVMAPVLLRPDRQIERLLTVVQSKRKDQRTIGRRERLAENLLEYAQRLRSLLGFSENPEIRRRLNQAGLREESATDLFFAAQAIGVLAGFVAGTFIHTSTLFWVLTAGVLGFMLPDLWLTRAVAKRRNKIRRSIPDAVDLLVICVDAGLGLDQALLRVGEELDLSHPEINAEFRRVNLEQRAGTPRIEAWKGLAERTRLEEFSAFVTMLTQTDRFGTPILKALAAFADDLRLKRRQAAEEAAAKTKIKIIFPLVLCIFPCLFIVLLAPALISIAAGLKTMGGQ
jgi:tight adherence protein C